MDITSLIVQLVGGVAGGNAVGKGVPNVDLGPLGNTIAGAIGGVGGGQILQMLVPMPRTPRRKSASTRWSTAPRARRVVGGPRGRARACPKHARLRDG